MRWAAGGWRAMSVSAQFRSMHAPLAVAMQAASVVLPFYCMLLQYHAAQPWRLGTGLMQNSTMVLFRSLCILDLWTFQKKSSTFEVLNVD